jgi:hypothetical protein
MMSERRIEHKQTNKQTDRQPSVKGRTEEKHTNIPPK